VTKGVLDLAKRFVSGIFPPRDIQKRVESTASESRRSNSDKKDCHAPAVSGCALRQADCPTFRQLLKIAAKLIELL